MEEGASLTFWDFFYQEIELKSKFQIKNGENGFRSHGRSYYHFTNALDDDSFKSINKLGDEISNHNHKEL